MSLRLKLVSAVYKNLWSVGAYYEKDAEDNIYHAEVPNMRLNLSL